MSRIVFEVKGQPVGKGRPRFVRATGHTYSPEKTRLYEKSVADAYTKAGGEVLDGYITIKISAFYKIPKSVSKERKTQMERELIKPIVKPDIDNVVKAILDALNGTAYHDDNQVVSVFAKKRYANEPFVKVEVENEF